MADVVRSEDTPSGFAQFLSEPEISEDGLVIFYEGAFYYKACHEEIAFSDGRVSHCVRRENHPNRGKIGCENFNGETLLDD